MDNGDKIPIPCPPCTGVSVLPDAVVRGSGYCLFEWGLDVPKSLFQFSTVILWCIFILLKSVYLFIWLHHVLAVALEFFSLFFSFIFIYLAALGLSCCMQDLCCNMQTLSCGVWDLVPWPGIEPGPPALGGQHRGLAMDPQWSPPPLFLSL